MPPGVFDLFGGSEVIKQIFIWQIAGEVIQGMIGPYTQLVANKANATWQEVPLSPGDLARLVVRGYYSEHDAIEEAKQSGISPDDFRALLGGTGNAPSPGELAEALRRGYIPEDDGDPHGISFKTGIAQGDLQNKWSPIVKKLATQIPSAAFVVNAYLEGQISEADARAKFTQVGGDPDWFDLMYHASGSSPTPTELGIAANRGIIPWDGEGPDSISFHQGYLEGPWRNKWEPVFREVAKYHPPPRTVTAMVRSGSLTDEYAKQLFQEAGLTPELAQAYLDDAHHGKLTAQRELTVGILETLYLDKLITRPTALQMIQDIGYDAQEAEFILSVQDLKRVQASLTRAANTIHTQYIGHKIDRNTASNALDSFGFDSDARDDLLQIWDVERSAKVALLTPTQIKKAADNGLIGADAAISRLLVIGYSQEDAEIFMQL